MLINSFHRITFDFTQVFSIFCEMLPKNSFLLVCLLFSITGLIDKICCDVIDDLIIGRSVTTSNTSTTNTHECETNSDPITVDITPTFVQTINQVLKNIISKLKPVRRSYSYSPQNVAETSISLNPEGINGLVSFSNISVVNYEESSPESLTCEFAEYLKVRIPLKNGKLVFRGRVYIHKNPSTKYETGEFHVTFNQITFSITKKSDSSVETDINYKNFNIELEVDHKDESAVLGMIDELIQTLVLYMKTSLNERSEDGTPRWYAYNILSLQKLFDTCMHPESNISRSYLDFTSSHEKYYYVINSQHSDSIGSVDLRINKIALNGLSNFKSIESYTHNYNSDYYGSTNSYRLLIENLNGYAEWQYYVRGEFSKHSNIIKFKIHDLSFSSDSSSIEFTLSFTCVQSNDSMSSFAKMILTDQLKTIITSNLQELFHRSQMYY